MNPLLPGGSGTTPEPTRNASVINQGTNEGESQNDPHPEASIFHGQREQNSGTERDYDTYSQKAWRLSTNLQNTRSKERPKSITQPRLSPRDNVSASKDQKLRGWPKWSCKLLVVHNILVISIAVTMHTKMASPQEALAKQRPITPMASRNKLSFQVRRKTKVADQRSPRPIPNRLSNFAPSTRRVSTQGSIPINFLSETQNPSEF